MYITGHYYMATFTIILHHRCEKLNYKLLLNLAELFVPVENINVLCEGLLKYTDCDLKKQNK